MLSVLLFCCSHPESTARSIRELDTFPDPSSLPSLVLDRFSPWKFYAIQVQEYDNRGGSSRGSASGASGSHGAPSAGVLTKTSFGSSRIARRGRESWEKRQIQGMRMRLSTGYHFLCVLLGSTTHARQRCVISQKQRRKGNDCWSSAKRYRLFLREVRPQKNYYNIKILAN